MTASTKLPSGGPTAQLEPYGVQRPRVFSIPASAVSTTSGEEAVELAAMAGLVLDPWEAFALTQAMAEDARGKWASFEVGLVVSRQNGKGSILEARELVGLFLLGEKLIVHSAHQFETSLEHFRRILELIESTPEFDSRVGRVMRSHGEEGIELKNGQRLKFKTRTKSGGRGLTGDLVILDEAMILDDLAIGALMPTMAAKSLKGNPQIWYTGSAGLEDSFVLGRLRRRGMRGGDPSLCYLEHSVDEAIYNVDPDRIAVDPEHIAIANPGLGIRISLDHVMREQRSMSKTEYARERLGIGQWPADPDEDWAIPRSVWLGLADASPDPPRPVGKVAFAVETTPDRKFTSISVAGMRPDGVPQVQVIENRTATGWVVGRLAQLASAYATCGVVVDMQSAAASLVEDLRLARITVIEMNTPDAKQAFGQFFDRCVEGTLRHLAQPELDAALKSATVRDVGDAKLWSRKNADADVTPLVSVTGALWGWQMRHASGDILSAVW